MRHTIPRSLVDVDDLTPSQKGAVAEAAITAMVIQLGLVVLRPLCEGRRYDLAIDLEPELLRVQCKMARQRRASNGPKPMSWHQRSRCFDHATFRDARSPGGYTS
jgi:PD-(D/E)XK endonuclease